MFLRDALVAACGRPFETGHLRTLQPAQRQGIVWVDDIKCPFQSFLNNNPQEALLLDNEIYI